MSNSFNLSHLSQNMEAICREKFKTVKDALIFCELSPSFIDNMKRVKQKPSMPSIDKVYQFADKCNVSIDYLVGRTQKKQLDTNEPSISYREKMLIDLLNQLSENDIDVVIGMVQTFVNTRTAQAENSFKEEEA